MALIGKIRNNSWLLVVLIGLGLGGFIMMDMTSGQQSIFGSQSTSLGKVAGESIEYNDFMRTESDLYAGSSSDVFSRRKALWDYYVENALLKEEAKELGLTITQEEFNNLQFGANPSPIISGAFRNPQTGQLDRAQLSQIQQAVETNQLNPQFREYWKAMQKQVYKSGLEGKLTTLVGKSLYVPTWMVEGYHKDNNDKVSFNYVRVPYDEIDDSEVSLTDSDYTAFLNDNKGTYYQEEETRKVAYTVFDVKPTAKDTSEIKGRLKLLLEKWEKETGSSADSQFVVANLGNYDESYYKKSVVAESISDIVFDSPVGTVHGPYMEGTDYKIVKVLGKMVIPDSVRARHILLKYTDAAGYSAAQVTVDSIINALENTGASFDDLAAKYSEDLSSSSKGGDLGYQGPGMFVPAFNNMVFYKAKKGEIRTVDTQFGTHIIEVMNQKFINEDEGVQLAYLSEPIIPSAETQRGLYSKVLEFSGKNSTIDALNAAAQEAGLEVVVSPTFMRNDFTVGLLGGGQSSRDIINFAYNSGVSVGQVSSPVFSYQDKVNNYTNKYVVAALESIVAAGMPTVAAVKDQIQTEVMNRAKAKLIEEKISGTDLASIAGSFNSAVDTVSTVAFSATFQPGLGNEPKVIATAFNTPVNQMSKPVVGNSGVFVLSPTQLTPSPSAPTIPVLRNQMSSSTQSQVGTRLMESVRKAADVKDNRATFF